MLVLANLKIGDIIMENKNRSGGMKNHKFWAWAALVCMIMVFYTGYEHK
jgi:hypothetical protein